MYPSQNTIHFNFMRMKKHNETFAGTYSKLLYIYREAKHILVIVDLPQRSNFLYIP